MTRTYNEGLEAAAKWHDDKARGLRSGTGYGGEIDARNHGCYARTIRALKREESPETSDPRDEIIRELRDKFAETGKRLRYLSDFCPNEEMDGNLEALARRCEDIANAELRDILAEALSKAREVMGDG